MEQNELTPYERKVYGLVKASRDGWYSNTDDGLRLRNCLRRLEERCLLDSVLASDGCGRVYTTVANPERDAKAGAIVAQINRGGEVGKSLHGKLFQTIIAKGEE